MLISAASNCGFNSSARLFNSACEVALSTLSLNSATGSTSPCSACLFSNLASSSLIRLSRALASASVVVLPSLIFLKRASLSCDLATEPLGKLGSVASWRNLFIRSLVSWSTPDRRASAGSKVIPSLTGAGGSVASLVSTGSTPASSGAGGSASGVVAGSEGTVSSLFLITIVTAISSIWRVNLITPDASRSPSIVTGIPRDSKSLINSFNLLTLPSVFLISVWIWDATLLRPICKISVSIVLGSEITPATLRALITAKRLVSKSASICKALTSFSNSFLGV